MALDAMQEPSNHDIMVKLVNIEKELGKAEKRDKAIAWTTFMAFSAGLLVSSIVVGQWTIMWLGVGGVIIGGIGVKCQWPPEWRV